MHSVAVLWIDARDTIPINDRPVLIVLANNWTIDVGRYKDGEGWRCHNVQAEVAYWADYPDTPPPPNYA